MFAAFEAAAALIAGLFFNTKRMVTVHTFANGVVCCRLAARGARLRFVGFDHTRERRHHFASVWDRSQTSKAAGSWCSSARVRWLEEGGEEGDCKCVGLLDISVMVFQCGGCFKFKLRILLYYLSFSIR